MEHLRYDRSNRRLSIFLMGFALVSLALFIAGAIMLAVGISRANAAAAAADELHKIATQEPPPQQVCPTAATPADNSNLVPPHAFFLTLSTSNITVVNLGSNYRDAIRQLQQWVGFLVCLASVFEKTE